jgi:hypothetical protein
VSEGTERCNAVSGCRGGPVGVPHLWFQHVWPAVRHALAPLREARARLQCGLWMWCVCVVCVWCVWTPCVICPPTVPQQPPLFWSPVRPSAVRRGCATRFECHRSYRAACDAVVWPFPPTPRVWCGWGGPCASERLLSSFVASKKVRCGSALSPLPPLCLPSPPHPPPHACALHIW